MPQQMYNHFTFHISADIIMLQYSLGNKLGWFFSACQGLKHSVNLSKLHPNGSSDTEHQEHFVELQCRNLNKFLVPLVETWQKEKFLKRVMVWNHVLCLDIYHVMLSKDTGNENKFDYFWKKGRKIISKENKK